MTKSHAARASTGLSFAIAALAVATSAAWAQALGPVIPASADGELLAPSAPAPSAAAQRDAELERIRQERQALLAQREAQEAACYKKFAVEDCLRGVRAEAREADALLRAQEIAVKDAERKEKAARRERAIVEKQKNAATPGQGGEAGTAGVGLRGPAADRTPSVAVRDEEAARRAQAQHDKIEQRSQAQKANAAGVAEREAQSRASYAEKLRLAQERRDKAAKAQAEEQASGKKQAAPLPQAPAAPR